MRPSMTFGTLSPAPPWPKAYRSRKYPDGSATGPSPRQSTSTGTSCPRLAVALVTPWIRPSADAHVPPMCPAALCVSPHRRSASCKGGESACRPGSVRPLARGGGHPSGTAVADSLVRSTRGHRAGRPRTLAQGTCGSPFDLAPGGVYLAAAVTCGAGGLLHRRFTLTPRRNAGRSVFCGTIPRVTPGRRYRPPCPVEPGPSSPGIHPARPPGRLTRTQDTTGRLC